MLIHLALAHPGAKLAPPPGTSRHAKFLQWMVFLSANVYEEVLRMYYSARYSARGDADATAIRQQAMSDFLEHVGLVSRSLGPYVLGAEYSIADVYLYMLAGWYPDGKAQLYEQLPALGAHAELLLRRTAVAEAEADHAS
jgi:glutathione S-transferase